MNELKSDDLTVLIGVPGQSMNYFGNAEAWYSVGHPHIAVRQLC